MRVSILVASSLLGAAAAAQEPTELRGAAVHAPIEILRDDFGIAHVFAKDDFDVFFGQGFAAAEDRMLQMDLVRRSVQGRLSEVLGIRPMGKRGRQTTLQHDRYVRIWGLYDHARRIYPDLDEPTHIACEGFAAGVNFYLKTRGDHLEELFERLGYRPEPWTAIDSVACWYQIAILLGGKWRNTAMRRPRAGRPAPRALPQRYTAEFDDESDCMVTQDDMRLGSSAYDELMRLAADKRRGRRLPELEDLLAALAQTENARPKMSHCWAVSAARSATGHAMLLSDPQLPVSNPPLLYEIHLHGGHYDVRGAGIPGSPGFLIGRNRHLAWGATAAGGHASNIYEETIDPKDPTRYLHAGVWKRARVREETIRVKGAEAVHLTVRETLHGPILNDLLPPGRRGGRTLSVSHVATIARTAPVQGLLAMGRARSFAEFREALRDYHLPAAHFLVIDDRGRIGYELGASIPYMPFGVTNDILDGAGGRFDWRPFEPDDGAPAHDHRGPFVPHRLLPQAFPIARGVLASANNASVGSWYPLAIGFRGRDTPRSIRLREMLAAKPKLTVGDMLAMHQDIESPFVRTWIYAALAFMAEQPPRSEMLLHAGAVLTGWDGKMRLDPRTWPLVAEIQRRLFRYANPRTNPELARLYGPGPIGAGNLAKRFTPLLQSGRTPSEPVARKAILQLTEEAMAAVSERFGPDESRWRLPANAGHHDMPYQNGLLGLGSLDPRLDLTARFDSLEVNTIRSPAGNCYSMLAEMGDVDQGWTLLPPGISEDPHSPHHKDQLEDWRAARLHRAFFSRAAIEKVATARVVISR